MIKAYDKDGNELIQLSDLARGWGNAEGGQGYVTVQAILPKGVDLVRGEALAIDTPAPLGKLPTVKKCGTDASKLYGYALHYYKTKKGECEIDVIFSAPQGLNKRCITCIGDIEELALNGRIPLIDALDNHKKGK